MAASLRTTQDPPTDPAWTGARLSPRLAALRADVMGRRGSWLKERRPFERDVALARVPAGLSTVQTRAATLRELVDLARLALYPGWRLAGEHLGGQSFDLPGPDPARAVAELAREYGLAPAEAGDVLARVQAWHSRVGRSYAIGEPLADNRDECGQWGGGVVYWAGGWTENHSVRDYARVLRVGFAGLRAEVEARLAGTDIADPEFPRRENFWKAARLVCEAGERLGARYAALAREQAAAGPDAGDRARLLEMAERCAQVPARPARTFAEAVQSLWLAHILTCGEDGINANSIGRLDQILAPYYEADLAAGRCTPDEAREWMEELACKLYLDYEVQAITLAGLDAGGRSAANALTRIVLEATRNVGFVRDVSVRLSTQTPDDVIRLSAELVARGGGIPFFFNDECFVPALAERGIPVEDARDYAPIGCIELTIPGKANPHAVSGWLNTTKCLELALFDGCDPATGLQLGPHTGAFEALAGYDAFHAAYRAQLAHFARRMVYFCNRGELAQREHGPLPLWSLLTHDCVARGRDITDGGARYHYHSVCCMGAANTADSLCALRRLVFGEKRVAPAELLAALRADFRGHEALRALLLSGAPKYGNDEPEVDTIAAEECGHFIELMDGFRSPLGGRYFVHLFTFLCNVDFGKRLGATPDGRRAGEPLAYSLSPVAGRDLRGVTALLSSLARLPHRHAAGASAAIVDLDPALVEGEAGIRTIEQLIRSAVRLGVGQLQFNVVTADRLEQARRDPEAFGNIPVRVAGYSQMFKLLSPDLQDHVIARTKHRR
jgi:formate C-acetyltransferase